jgi:hypothetical protein
MSRARRPSRSGSGSEWSSAFRRDDDADATAEEETLCFGCSMLSRIRMRPRNPGAMRLMRCSLGYALTTDDDVAKCLSVEGPSSCWKAATPSWRVMPQVEMAPRPVEPRANGRQRPAPGANGSVAERVELVAPGGDEAKDVELTIVEVVGDDA